MFDDVTPVVHSNASVAIVGSAAMASITRAAFVVPGFNRTDAVRLKADTTAHTDVHAAPA